MKRNENLPLHLIERLNSRVSLMVSILVLALACLIFNRIDYVMIRKPAQEAQKANAARQDQQTGGRNTASSGQTSAGSSTAQSVSTAKILAAGDNFIEGSVLRSGSEKGWNYDHLYANVAEEIRGADLALVNQETPFTSNHELTSNAYPYATPTEVGDALANAGFSVVSAATEYMASSGQDFLSQTMEYWSQNHPEVKVLGVRQGQAEGAAKVVEVNGIRIALLNYVMPIRGRTIDLSAASSREEDENGFTDDETGIYYAYDEESGEYYPVTDVSSQEETQEGGYVLDVFDQDQVSAMVSQAKTVSDCIIVCTHYGKEGEPMPTEYQKEWANFLLAQGVDVAIGSFSHTISPYGTLQDEEGHSMLVYYGLGNFISGGENIKQLLGGLAEFTIQKTTNGKNVEVSIINPDLVPVVMHYDYDTMDYGVRLLSDYTDALASSHSVATYFNEDFSVKLIQSKCDEILSMKVAPAAKTGLLSVVFDSEGNMYDENGDWVEDTDSVSSAQYYGGE